MSGFGATIGNYLTLCARIAPFFLVLFFVIIAFFDGNYGLKGFFYLGCILVLSAVVMTASTMISENDGETNTHPICRMFDFPLGDKSGYNPALNSAIIAFTLIYMLMPMVQNDSYNIELIVLISTLYLVDLFMSSPLKYKCTSWTGIFSGTVIGMVLSLIIVASVNASDNRQLLFFNELKSNSVVCKRPAKQTFKCNVMKGGELVTGYQTSTK